MRPARKVYRLLVVVGNVLTVIGCSGLLLAATGLIPVQSFAVGISSGANFLGALKLQNEMGKDAVVVTVFADSNKKYLSTDLMNDEPVKEGFLSPNVELLDFRAFKRVCHTCCDPSDCVESHYHGSDIGFMLPHCARRIDSTVNLPEVTV